MDWNDSNQVRREADLLKEVASQYKEAINKFSCAYYKILELEAKHYDEIKKLKSNAGIEMSMMLLIKVNPEAAEIVKKYYQLEGQVKGLEKQFKAIESSNVTNMSLIKNKTKETNHGI